jgi:hypothetical protein
MEFKEFIETLKEHCIWILDQQAKGLTRLTLKLEPAGNIFKWTTICHNRMGDQQENSMFLEDGDFLVDMMAVRKLAKHEGNEINMFLIRLDGIFPEMNFRKYAMKQILVNQLGVGGDAVEKIMSAVDSHDIVAINAALSEAQAASFPNGMNMGDMISPDGNRISPGILQQLLSEPKKEE